MIFSLFRKSTFALFLILIAWAPWLVPAAYSAVWQWSSTASSNASVDPTINWREGQSPSSINDSARAMMARLAEYRDDISGSLTTSGTSTAYSVTTNQGLCSGTTVPQDGQQLAITVNATNGLSPTLTADSCAAYPIQSTAGVAVPAATMISGSPYSLRYSVANSAWMLRDLYASPYNIPLGGFLVSTISTPPNSNFITPAGQCISTTTYAAYWTAIGSPASGSCPGGQFAVIDGRGRNLTMVDGPPGFSAANRLTASSTGCGTSFNTMGATCSNGTESVALSSTNMAPFTPSFNSFSVTFPSTVAGQTPYFITPGGCCVGFGGSSTGATDFSLAGTSMNISYNFNSNGGNSTPFSRVGPNVAVYVYLRVL